MQTSRQLSYHDGLAGRDRDEHALINSTLAADDAKATAALDRYDSTYHCRFECIPASVTYRPVRVTPRPMIRGCQTARVVGPESEEIHTDKYGRVRVQFHWDLEGGHAEDASCGIRVSQGMAGGGYGMMFLPRVGQEVVVSFLNGDPDEPLITGRVYNGDHMPPYELPKHKTRSAIKTQSSKGGGGCNEIRFEDLKGKEQLLLQAQRRMDTRAKGDHHHTIGGTYHLTAGQMDRNGNDQGGLVEEIFRVKDTLIHGNSRVVVDDDASVRVGGMRSEEIAGTDSRFVEDDVIENFYENHKHSVRCTYESTAENIKFEALKTIELKCGGSSIVLTPSAVFITGAPIVNLNSGKGPSVTPVTCKITNPDNPDQPDEAEATDPGRDTRYDGAARDNNAQAEATEAESNGEGNPNTDSWIELELLNEMDQAVPDEFYRILTPGGRVREGRLDANGVARIEGIDPGDCEITFPNLDHEAWERE
ncbi:MAG: type VI secretion system tip protein TssI/VgrG [Planctomycetota bacterium]|jgi:type VI secretion system secreted protein VgrG